MLQAYLPALVFMLVGAGAGLALAHVNGLLGPRRPNPVKREPYESGIPSSGAGGRPFPTPYYLVGMMFLVFDVEVILLYPAVLHLEPGARHALIAIAVFIGVIAVAFVYELLSGSLDWGPTREAGDVGN